MPTRMGTYDYIFGIYLNDHGTHREGHGQRSTIEDSLGYMSHCPIKPTVPGGSTKYPMTQIGGFGSSGRLNSFPEGVDAFQNARDWAMKKERRAHRRCKCQDAKQGHHGCIIPACFFRLYTDLKFFGRQTHKENDQKAFDEARCTCV